MKPQPLNLDSLPYPELRHVIVASGKKIHHILKPGLSAKAYENALAIELRSRGLHFKRDQVFDVYYAGELVDIYTAPLVVEGLILLEVTTSYDLLGADMHRFNCALATTRLHLGIMLAFQPAELEWRHACGLNATITFNAG